MKLNILKPRLDGNFLYNKERNLFATAVINANKDEWTEITPTLKHNIENLIEDEFSTKLDEETL